MTGDADTKVEATESHGGIAGAGLFTVLATAMFYLEGCLAFLPKGPPLVLVLFFGLGTFALLAGAPSFDAAWGRACFVFALLWLLLYPVGSLFSYRASILTGGQEVMTRQLSILEYLGEGLLLGAVELLATGWTPAAMAGVSVALGIGLLWSGKAGARPSEG